ncbi:MAG: hypothetical protein ABMA14_16530 [Hyphomonadaceae bacterium]
MKAQALLLVLFIAGAAAGPTDAQSTTSRWALVGDYKGQSMLFLGLDTITGGETARNAIGLGVYMVDSHGQAPMHQTAYVFDCNGQSVRETEYWFYESDLTLRNSLTAEEPAESWASASDLVASMALMACGHVTPTLTFPDMTAAAQYARSRR